MQTFYTRVVDILGTRCIKKVLNFATLGRVHPSSLPPLVPDARLFVVRYRHVPSHKGELGMRRLLIAVAILTGIGGGAASYNGLPSRPSPTRQRGTKSAKCSTGGSWHSQHPGHHVDLCARRGGL